ncbi:MAG: cobalamin-dependent protein [Caldiserica bacterium]|jgi:beta-lysine 5,6-aminomutase beta subunit|nr:cobalamin-dependent protein [Caldisericota bacterium]MDH7562761.1 OAM dimerization domain-containing protein [Caldisericota bacterium]
MSFGSVKPYGDRMNDGAVQVSFSLPVPLSPRSLEAAKIIGEKFGLTNVRVVFSRNMGDGFSFYILYGSVNFSVDLDSIHVPEVNIPLLNFEEINDLIKREIKKKVVVLGATIGSDAHTVGLDAILSAKGFGGEPGLERFPIFEVHNLGAQVPPEQVAEFAFKYSADVVLISQVVTQRNIHLANLSLLSELIEAEGIREKVLLICGGPYIRPEVALEVGFDAGFGPGTTPLQVASFIVLELIRRKFRKK